MTASKAQQAAEEYGKREITEAEKCCPQCHAHAIKCFGELNYYGCRAFVAGIEWQKAQDEKKIMIAKEALYWAKEMLLARDVMNSKAHCAPVKFSPLTERLRQALEEIDELE